MFPTGKYMFRVINKSTRTRCEICSKLTIKTRHWHYWRHSGVFIVNLEHISHLAPVFLLLTLKSETMTYLRCIFVMKFHVFIYNVLICDFHSVCPLFCWGGEGKLEPPTKKLSLIFRGEVTFLRGERVAIFTQKIN